MAGNSNPPLDLAEYYVQPVCFGKQTLTFRMGDEYAAGKFKPGECTLKSKDGAEIPVTLTQVPIAYLGNPKGTTHIKDLTPEDLIASGILHSGQGFTEKSLSVRHGREGLTAAQRFVEKNIVRDYPAHEGHSHHGLDTQIYALRWKAPEIASTLNELERAFKDATPLLTGGAAIEPSVTYFPDSGDANNVSVVYQVKPRKGIEPQELELFLDGSLNLAFSRKKGIAITENDSGNGEIFFTLHGSPSAMIDAMSHISEEVKEMGKEYAAEGEYAASLLAPKAPSRRR